MEQVNTYDLVIGLEVHIQLGTLRKVFAPEGFSFGEAPNSQVSEVTMAHPGSLPIPNMECIYRVAKLGLALGCEIAAETRFARKNYFYPDLPKGYQLSQAENPICMGGELPFILPDGTQGAVALERIHMEEDAGKLIHDQHATASMVDLNRAGTGLAELVTRPELHSPEAAAACFASIQQLVRYLGVGEGDMEKGMLRCDANVSLKPAGAAKLGTRVEVKNLNSFNFLQAAIRFEAKRQAELLRSGELVQQETRTFNPSSGTTAPMRDKETAADYRYFPDPDLQPIRLGKEKLASLKAEIPSLPLERLKQYREEYGMAHAKAVAIISEKTESDYFEGLIASGCTPKAAANWLLGPVREFLKEQKQEITSFPLDSVQLTRFINLVEQRTITREAAMGEIWPRLLAKPDVDPRALAENLGLMARTDTSELEQAMKELVDQFPNEVARYRKGKKGLKGFFVGELMKKFGKKADPKTVSSMVIKVLEEKN
ncbi:MAG: Asp-tRNA(Asn)/Glu-tRNA(Gln) amidotransferase subunit GatB [Bacteroidota bacterium]